MQIDKAPFPVHTLEFNNPKVLIRPEQAEGAKGKNVVIGDPKPMNVNDKILAREVTKEKTPDGESTLKIIAKAPRLGGQGSSPSDVSLLHKHDRSDRVLRPVRPVRAVKPVCPAGRTGPVIIPGLSSLNVRKWVLGRLMR
jgi:hypothetical protein